VLWIILQRANKFKLFCERLASEGIKIHGEFVGFVGYRGLDKWSLTPKLVLSFYFIDEGAAVWRLVTRVVVGKRRERNLHG
jgi:hypothetical protein